MGNKLYKPYRPASIGCHNPEWQPSLRSVLNPDYNCYLPLYRLIIFSSKVL